MFRRRDEKQQSWNSSSAGSVDGGGGNNRPPLRRRMSVNSAASFGCGNSVASFSGGSVGGATSNRIPRQIGIAPSSSASVGGGSVTGSGSHHRRVPTHITGTGSGSGSTSVRGGRRTSLDTHHSFAEYSAASKDDSTLPRAYCTPYNHRKGIMRYTTLAESLQTVFGNHHHRSYEGTLSTNLSHNKRVLYGLHSQPSERSMDTHTTGSSARYSRSSLCSDQRRRRVYHHVDFGSVEVREYLRIVGDNPACSCGPPISIGWDYYPTVQLFELDEYEEVRRPKRRLEMDLVLPRHVREEILAVEWGICHTDMVHAVYQVIRVKNQRRISIHQKNGSVLKRTGSKLLRKLLLKRDSTKEALELQRQHMAYMAQQDKYTQQLREQKDLAEEEEAQLVRPEDEGFDYASYYLQPEERTRYVCSPVRSPKKTVTSVPSNKIKIVVPAMVEDQRDLHFMPDRHVVAI